MPAAFLALLTIAALAVLLAWMLWRSREKWFREWLDLSREHAHALDQIAYLREALEEHGINVPGGYRASVVLHALQAQQAEGLVSPFRPRRQGPRAADEPLSRVPPTGGLGAPGEASGGGGGPRDPAAPGPPDANTEGALPPMRPPYPRHVPRGPQGGGGPGRAA